MAVLITFSVVGIIATLIGLIFLGIQIGSSLAVELRSFKYKVKRNSEVKKEAIDADAEFKAEQLKQIREKEQDLANIRLQKKLDKLDKKILLESKKEEEVQQPTEEPKEEKKEEVSVLPDGSIEKPVEEPKQEPVVEQPAEVEEKVVEEKAVISE